MGKCGRVVGTERSNTPSPLLLMSYNLINSFIGCLKRYAVFSGRACRSEFWFWQLATFIISFVISFVVSMATDPQTGSLASQLLCLVVLLPNLAVSVRRLHDTGRSGWNILLALIPFIGAVILIVFWCQASQGGNKYGEGPLAPEA